MDNIEDNVNGIDTEYIRYLMLYSDQKYPFEKAKSDPGMSESVRGVRSYMSKHGETRKFDHKEANRILLQEKHAREQFMLNKGSGERRGRDIDEEFTPKAENQINNLEREFKTKSDLENEIAALKKQVMDKEAELKARASNDQPVVDRGMWNKLNVPPKKEIPPSDSGIIERKLEDTGYSDKINNT